GWFNDSRDAQLTLVIGGNEKECSCAFVSGRTRPGFGSKTPELLDLQAKGRGGSRRHMGERHWHDSGTSKFFFLPYIFSLPRFPLSPEFRKSGDCEWPSMEMR